MLGTKASAFTAKQKGRKNATLYCVKLNTIALVRHQNGHFSFA